MRKNYKKPIHKKEAPKGRKPKGYIMQLMLAGYNNQQIVEILQEEYAYQKHYAEDLVSQVKLKIDYKLDELADEVAKKNINRLEAIIDDSMINGDTKNALQAIDLQNKMLNIYQQKIQIGADKDNTFKITINNE